MNTRALLLAAVLDNPGEDTPRLALADPARDLMCRYLAARELFRVTLAASMRCPGGERWTMRDRAAALAAEADRLHGEVLAALRAGLATRGSRP